MNHLTMECWNADSLLHRFTDSTQVLGSDNHSWNNNESHTNRVWVCLFEQYQYLPSIYPFFLSHAEHAKAFVQTLLPATAVTTHPGYRGSARLGMFTWHCLILSCDKRQVWRSSGLGVDCFFLFSSRFHDFISSWCCMIHDSKFKIQFACLIKVSCVVKSTWINGPCRALVTNNTILSKLPTTTAIKQWSWWSWFYKSSMLPITF